MTSADSYYVLDGDDRITLVSGKLRTLLGAFLGHSFWDVAPQARSIFGPHFDLARESGREVEFTDFYAGRVSWRRVVPTGDILTIYTTTLRKLDVTTLGTLAASLRGIEEELAARGPERPGRRAAASLQALP